MQVTATLPQLLHGFFQNWLIQQRGTSPHTVISYRDTWRLFLRFVAEQRQQTVAKLTIEQITAKEVLAFLDHCEKGRKVSIGTRNCRLAALRSFFSFVTSREPLLAAQCAEVLGVPTKRAPVRLIRSMEVEEIEAILAQPNRKLWRASAIMHCWLYCTTQAPAFRRCLTCAPRKFDLNRPPAFASLAKGRKNGTVRSGPKRWPY